MSQYQIWSFYEGPLGERPMGADSHYSQHLWDNNSFWDQIYSSKKN